MDPNTGDTSDNYTTWNIGVMIPFGKWAFDIRYFDADMEGAELYGPSGDSISKQRGAPTIKSNV